MPFGPSVPVFFHLSRLTVLKTVHFSVLHSILTLAIYPGKTPEGHHIVPRASHPPVTRSACHGRVMPKGRHGVPQSVIQLYMSHQYASRRSASLNDILSRVYLMSLPWNTCPTWVPIQAEVLTSVPAHYGQVFAGMKTTPRVCRAPARTDRYYRYGPTIAVFSCPSMNCRLIARFLGHPFPSTLFVDPAASIPRSRGVYGFPSSVVWIITDTLGVVYRPGTVRLLYHFGIQYNLIPYPFDSLG